MLKARSKMKRLEKFLRDRENILDIGCGNGAFVLLCRKARMKVDTIDVRNKSAFGSVRPQVYDGTNLPFADKTFDTAMLITVLHHTPSPEEILKEAIRVADKLVVMEDVYTGTWQKYLTWWVDSLVNLEFRGHPHTNKTDAEWKRCFTDLGLELETYREYRFLLLFRQTLYCLKSVR